MNSTVSAASLNTLTNSTQPPDACLQELREAIEALPHALKVRTKATLQALAESRTALEFFEQRTAQAEVNHAAARQIMARALEPHLERLCELQGFLEDL